MKIKDILKLGGDGLSKDVMSSKVMIATGDTLLTEFANKLWNLITNTDYLRPSIHAVLVKGYTHKEASETYDESEGYIRNLVGLEGKRLEEDIGLDVVPYLLGDKKFDNQTQIMGLNKVVEGLLETVNLIEEDLFDKIQFNIQNKRSVRSNRIGDQEFIKTVQDLEFLSKPKMESRLEGIPEDTIGYIVYLLRTDEKYLTKADETRKDIIKEVWWL